MPLPLLAIGAVKLGAKLFAGKLFGTKLFGGVLKGLLSKGIGSKLLGSLTNLFSKIRSSGDNVARNQPLGRFGSNDTAQSQLTSQRLTEIDSRFDNWGSLFGAVEKFARGLGLIMDAVRMFESFRTAKFDQLTTGTHV